MTFVNNNGELMLADTPHLLSSSRAFSFGDGVFETIRIKQGKIVHFKGHYERLMKGAEAIKMKVDSSLTQEFFQSQIEALIAKNRVLEGGRCKLSLDRANGGTYKPLHNYAQFFIEVNSIDHDDFALNERGLEIDIYKEMVLTKNPLSPYKTKNALFKVMASLHAESLRVDDLLLQNEKGNLIESTNSNLFIVSNGVLYTPGMGEGCIAGTMRMHLINLAVTHGIRVYECPILPQNLLSADEVLLTNSIQGIRWVSQYKSKTYGKGTATRLIEWLNEETC
ncbi:MAG: aminotransferase class IV [Flavobacteriales bacterium]